MEWFTKGRFEEIGLFEVLKACEDEYLKLPLYQRDAIWSEGRICALWDSLLRGFPMPSFLLVRGKGDSSRPLSVLEGRREVSDKGSGPYFDILDGQQRFAAMIAGEGTDSKIRLWIDLAPPKNRMHPLKFKYWLHPCTKMFPFGFKMQKSGEHDFQTLTDSELQDIWEHIQDITEFQGKEFYELPLKNTFPWDAQCPVPFADLLNLLRRNDATENLQNLIREIADSNRHTLGQFGKSFLEPDADTTASLAKGLERVSKARLALQYVDFEGMDEDSGEYELFERIGRGGIQITPRQLAVSKLLLTLGRSGNDALANFQGSKYGQMLETEDVVHALARVALAEVKPTINTAQGTESETLEETEAELLDLSVERLHRMKTQNKRLWKEFTDKLASYCEVQPDGDGIVTRLTHAFERVFSILQYNQTNPNGFPLVQFAQPTRKEEGVAPITLHPLLLWQLKYSQKQPPNVEQREEMLRWILFSNGFVSNRQHDKLNRKIFNDVNRTGRWSFGEILKFVFGDEDTNAKLREALGFSWNEPRLNHDGTVEDIGQDLRGLPTPKQMVALSAKRLLLRNWAHSSVNRFTLIWNQREGLHKLYGGIQEEHIPALFSKGRPFDADHIVARSRLEGDRGLVQAETLMEGVKHFFSNNLEANKHVIAEWCFRLNLPNMSGNFRYWPKRLNRADSNDGVKNKMQIDVILNRLGKHPIKKHFDAADLEGKGHSDCAWFWSAIPIEDKSGWEKVPPEKNNWTPELVEVFIRQVLAREYYCYGNAYHFLTGDKVDKFDHMGIIL